MFLKGKLEEGSPQLRAGESDQTPTANDLFLEDERHLQNSKSASNNLANQGTWSLDEHGNAVYRVNERAVVKRIPIDVAQMQLLEIRRKWMDGVAKFEHLSRFRLKDILLAWGLLAATLIGVVVSGYAPKEQPMAGYAYLRCYENGKYVYSELLSAPAAMKRYLDTFDDCAYASIVYDVNSDFKTKPTKVGRERAVYESRKK